MTPEQERAAWEKLVQEWAPLNDCIINKHSFENELEQHAERMRRVLQNELTAQEIVDIRTREKSELFNTLSSDYRAHMFKEHEDNKGPKPTDKAVAEHVRGDKSYVSIAMDLSAAERMRKRWEQLGKSYMERGRRMDNLVKVYLSEQGRNYRKDTSGLDEVTRPERKGLDEFDDIRLPPAYQQTPAVADTDQTDRPTRRRRATDVQ